MGQEEHRKQPSNSIVRTYARSSAEKHPSPAPYVSTKRDLLERMLGNFSLEVLATELPVRHPSTDPSARVAVGDRAELQDNLRGRLPTALGWIGTRKPFERNPWSEMCNTCRAPTSAPSVVQNMRTQHRGWLQGSRLDVPACMVTVQSLSTATHA